MISRAIVLASLIAPLMAQTLSAGAIAGIIIGATFGFIFLALLIGCILASCQETSYVYDDIVTIPVPPVTDPYLMPTQTTANPIIAQNIANAYLNTGYQSNQFLLNPYPSPALPPALPHLQAIHPINPSATYLGRDTCSVCFEGGTNIKLVPCTHQFHANCIAEWCNKRRICPNCNATDFQPMVLCSNCHQFNQIVTLCPVGCQKPNHMNCFMQRNQGKLICRNCSSGGRFGMGAPLQPFMGRSITAQPIGALSQQMLMVPQMRQYPPQQIVYM